jgi:multisubunit Na+/H+ antiporter MnhB subunit
MSWLVGAVAVIALMVAFKNAFYMRPRDRRFRSGYKWNEAAVPPTVRRRWLGVGLLAAVCAAAILIVLADSK